MLESFVYGERLLVGKPTNEMEVLDHVIRALLASDDADSARRALVWVKRYEADVAEFRAKGARGPCDAGSMDGSGDRAYARATVLEARGIGNLGNPGKQWLRLRDPGTLTQRLRPHMRLRDGW